MALAKQCRSLQNGLFYGYFSKGHKLFMALAFHGCITKSVLGQQFPKFTQYMYNTVSINPAYTSGRGGLDVLALHRNQWVGVNAGPKTYMLSLYTALKDETMNLGMSAIHDQFGALQDTYIAVDFSYSIQWYRQRKMTLGIKSGINSRDINQRDLNFFQANDDAFQNDLGFRIKPSIGIGAFYSSRSLYLGLSLSNILEEKVWDQNIKDTSGGRHIHYFLIGGYVHEVNSVIKLKPAFLVKYLKGGPPQLDISLNTLWQDKGLFGLAYRPHVAYSAMIGFHLSQSVLMGLAYDRDLGEMANVEGNLGTFELFLSLNLFAPPKRYLTPRFF